ncbi:LuxR C-terminal-related transcriptional regulator [Aurantibacter sp.]|uniref:helix-turn-helix domain-containing protein n=1 Tax=Aurantibacter sp. TaxID=2807103 RepID=UPI0035C8719D
MRYLQWFVFLFLISFYTNAQHKFEGFIDNTTWQNNVYLSVVDDYRTINGINNEQIISKTTTDSLGRFEFSGDLLEPIHQIYKLHVDNCDSENLDENHFIGHCKDSKDILFIAKSTDSIKFPLSFDAQMFCDITSNNSKNLAIIKVDNLIEEMKFSYSEYNSNASRNLNNKKWFKTLQDFGKKLKEPLAELYIYSFLSDRTKPFHDYYLEDLRTNTYYTELLNRLKTNYPNSKYTNQFETELQMDQFGLGDSEKKAKFNFIYLLSGILLTSLLLNFWQYFKSKKQKSESKTQAKAQLTKQEQTVLDLILENKSNKEIAETLFVSLSTVKSHINNIYKKVNVSSRNEIKELFYK